MQFRFTRRIKEVELFQVLSLPPSFDSVQIKTLFTTLKAELIRAKAAIRGVSVSDLLWSEELKQIKCNRSFRGS